MKSTLHRYLCFFLFFPLYLFLRLVLVHLNFRDGPDQVWECFHNHKIAWLARAKRVFNWWTFQGRQVERLSKSIELLDTKTLYMFVMRFCSLNSWVAHRLIYRSDTI